MGRHPFFPGFYHTKPKTAAHYPGPILAREKGGRALGDIGWPKIFRQGPAVLAHGIILRGTGDNYFEGILWVVPNQMVPFGPMRISRL